MSARHLLLESPALGRKVHVWAFGEMGIPLIAFPSNAGTAHEWMQSGMIDALSPLLAQGKLKIYCPESNISQTFTAPGPLRERLYRHSLYERFVVETMLPFIRADCRMPHVRPWTAGCSMGALYAALFALKYPELFPRALCMSGRYRGHHFGRGEYTPELYFNDPLAFVPNLKGIALERVRQQIFLVLVVGRGPYEGGCLPETIEFARVLSEAGIPHHLAVWGADSAHEYKWWKKQALFYIGQMLDQKW